MRLLVIRHGESEGDILNVHEGRADFNLTEEGHKQAQAMAEYVKTHYKVDKIYSSPLKRARQTAEHLEKELGLLVQEENNLMEFNNGLLAGLSYAEADTQYPKIDNLPPHKSVYEQESRLQFRHRADVVLSEIMSAHKENETVVIVSHGGMINQLYNSFLKLPVDSGMIFGTGDTGIHEWIVRGDERIVWKANMQEHIS